MPWFLSPACHSGLVYRPLSPVSLGAMDKWRCFTFDGLFIGQTGYYLVWDERSLLLTRMTVSAFEALPIIGAPLKAWFINGSTITNLTLSNFLFIHIGLSFALLFVLWLHYVRMTRPVLTPPPAVNFILVASILFFVWLIPITSGKMANLNSQPNAYDMDWFFLWNYWLMAHMPLALFWLLMVAAAAPELKLNHERAPRRDARRARWWARWTHGWSRGARRRP